MREQKERNATRAAPTLKGEEAKRESQTNGRRRRRRKREARNGRKEQSTMGSTKRKEKIHRALRRST
jgi:hypothetical protein